MKMSDWGVKLLQVLYTLTKYISIVQIIIELALGTRGLNEYLNTHSSRRVMLQRETLVEDLLYAIRCYYHLLMTIKS